MDCFPGRRSVCICVILCDLLTTLTSAAQRPDARGARTRPRRVALVIGNQSYPGKGAAQKGAAWGELRAPRSDARRVADKLARPPLGFAVTLLYDQSRRDMQRALETFFHDIEGAQVAVFYFSGHGFSAGGQSHLVPIDVLDRQVAPNQRPPKFVPVQQVAAEIKRRATFGLMFLDACRDEAGGGFLRVEGIPSRVAGKGQIFVSYAAPLGRRANDAREGANSPYTTALLSHLDKPDLSVQQMMAEIGKSLLVLTRDAGRSSAPHQEHQVAGGIYDPLYLAGQTDVGVLARAREAARREQALWDEALAHKDREQVWHYLRRYPEGRFAPAASDLLDHMDWDDARKEARRSGHRQPVDAYLVQHPDGLHRKDAADWMRPLWKKPTFWLGLGAGLVAVGASVGLGVGLTQRQPDLSSLPGGNSSDWTVRP